MDSFFCWVGVEIQPKNTYTFVNDPSCPRTVWPEPYRCAYQRKLMIRFSEKIAPAELEKKNDTPRHFNPNQVKLTGLSKCEKAKTAKNLITKSTSKLKGNGPANQNDRMDEVMMEEFEKFKQLNPDLAENKISKKDLTFYWNLIRSNNMKVSKT